MSNGSYISVRSRLTISRPVPLTAGKIAARSYNHWADDRSRWESERREAPHFISKSTVADHSSSYRLSSTNRQPGANQPAFTNEELLPRAFNESLYVIKIANIEHTSMHDPLIRHLPSYIQPDAVRFKTRGQHAWLGYLRLRDSYVSPDLC